MTNRSGSHAHTQNVLDRIWHSQLPRVQAAQLTLEDITKSDALILFRYQLEAEAGSLVSFSNVNFDSGSMEITVKLSGHSAVSFVTQEANDVALCRFTDVPWYLTVRDASFLKAFNHTFSVSAASILAALQYCRDHVDSLLYLPNEMRTRRFDDESQGLGVPVAFLKSLAVTYRSTERSLEAGN